MKLQQDCAETAQLQTKLIKIPTPDKVENSCVLSIRFVK